MGLTAIYFGNPLWSWMAAALVAAGAVAAAALLQRSLRKRLEPGDDQRSGFARAVILQVIQSTSLLLVLVFTVSTAGVMLVLPEKIERMLTTAAVAALSIQAALWIHGVIARLTRQGEARAADRDPGSVTTIRTLGFLGKAALWTIMVLVALHNAGINITALVAGLGIGGIAVALALQNILADVFASISIILDKPYQVGDLIVVGDSMGTVERIGIKTTRVRSLGGEELVFSNGDLLRSRIRNFRRMSERRVEFTIGVPFDTPHDKAERIPPLLRDIIGGNDLVRLERAHFKEFGESSLTFECVYFVRESDYELYLGIQESINLEILRRFQEEEIALAHPSRTLYIAQGVAPVRW
jgi:small-conductance mechanosensitive channel